MIGEAQVAQQLGQVMHVIAALKFALYQILDQRGIPAAGYPTGCIRASLHQPIQALALGCVQLGRTASELGGRKLAQRRSTKACNQL